MVLLLTESPTMTVTESIVIEGDTATIVETKKVRQVDLSSIIQQLQTSNGIKTPILPEGCIYFGQRGSRVDYLLTTPPSIISGATRSNDNLLIPTPRKLYHISFNGSAVNRIYMNFIRDVPKTFGMLIAGSWLPNQSESGQVCLGVLDADVHRISGINNKLRLIIDSMQGQSMFNDDYSHYKNRTPEFIRDLDISSISDDASMSALKIRLSRLIDDDRADGVSGILLKWTLWTKDRILSGVDPVREVSDWSAANQSFAGLREL